MWPFLRKATNLFVENSLFNQNYAPHLREFSGYSWKELDELSLLQNMKVFQ